MTHLILIAAFMPGLLAICWAVQRRNYFQQMKSISTKVLGIVDRIESVDNIDFNARIVVIRYPSPLPADQSSSPDERELKVWTSSFKVGEEVPVYVELDNPASAAVISFDNSVVIPLLIGISGLLWCLFIGGMFFLVDA